jgi:hypothetical protein
LRDTTDYIVEPVYEPLTETPVNERGEEWPACPAGWVFDDWMFVNGTSSELNISEIRFGRSAIPVQVNEPLGGSRVKLSFERLNLQAGDATKLSVCLNKEAIQIEFTEFGLVRQTQPGDSIASSPQPTWRPVRLATQASRLLIPRAVGSSGGPRGNQSQQTCHARLRRHESEPATHPLADPLSERVALQPKSQAGSLQVQQG